MTPPEVMSAVEVVHHHIGRSLQDAVASAHEGMNSFFDQATDMVADTDRGLLVFIGGGIFMLLAVLYQVTSMCAVALRGPEAVTSELLPQPVYQKPDSDVSSVVMPRRGSKQSDLESGLQEKFSRRESQRKPRKEKGKRGDYYSSDAPLIASRTSSRAGSEVSFAYAESYVSSASDLRRPRYDRT